MNGPHHEFQANNAVGRQPDNDLGIACCEIHGRFRDALFERAILLAIGCQRLVQFVFGNRPSGALGVCTVRFESPQHQRARNEVVGTIASRNDMLFIEVVIGDLYPCPVRMNTMDYLSVQRVSHIVAFYRKSMRISSLFFLYLNVPLLAWRFRSRHKSPYICSSES